MSLHVYQKHYREGDKCPYCPTGKLGLIKSKFLQESNSEANKEQYFLGCSAYPKCKGTISPFRTLENSLPKKNLLPTSGRRKT